jgi:predicted DNA-binding transcriptional regulator YafY
MNPGKSAYRRYKVIDGMLRNPMRRFPTIEDIIEACFQKLDFRPSVETIQKDMANMKLPYPDGFDAPIKFNRSKMGYEYSDPDYSMLGLSLRPEDIEAIYDAVDLIQSLGGSKIGEKFSHAAEKLFSTIVESKREADSKRTILQTMRPPISRGYEHFDLFYHACKEKIPVSIIHYSYKKRIFNHVLLHPFLIKEFENRWYVIGYSEFHKEPRTFGLDRITDPVLLTKKYIDTDTSIIHNYLHEVYGVFTIPNANSELIEIHVSLLGTHYFQAYPIHESQKIEKDGNGTSLIKFEMIPSIELSRYFLSQGRHVTIINPRWFKEFTKSLAE